MLGPTPGALCKSSSEANPFVGFKTWFPFRDFSTAPASTTTAILQFQRGSVESNGWVNL